MRLRFITIDVFTRRPFGGNPVAVVLNGERLGGGDMQRIAGEFNLSETTFVLPPRDPDHTAEVRIFTPRAEMPFAGHPNIGTGYILGVLGTSHGKPVSDPLTFEEKAGLVRIDLLKEDGAVTGARLAAPRALSRGADIPASVAAAACGLAASDIESSRHAPCLAGCGATFVFAELSSRRALAEARPVGDVFRADLPMDMTTGLHLYVREPGDGADIQSRMFAPLHGIEEDPATGSANLALIGLLAALAPEADLTLDRTIAQGFDMGRPSLMAASARKQAGTVTGTWIGGRCVRMMEGFLDLD